jgi:peptide chain release factor 3
VFDLLTDQLLRFRGGEEKQSKDTEVVVGLDNPRLDELFPHEAEVLREEVGLVRGASSPFDLEMFLAGMQTPVFFGSGINNFGVQEVLKALIEWAPPPQPRAAAERAVAPAEDPLTGFVFKIQANMDPKHRDRIAFFRLCSGRYSPGMKLAHLRLGREMRIANAQTFMANSRKASDGAVAGDIIGIHNHGQLQIGDTLTEGEQLTFKGIPYFAPELFVSARPEDPLKAKQLQKGLKELGEEGAVQVFTNELGRRLLGAVGRLQFDIVAHRLKGEYNVDALYEPADIYTARWLSFPDAATRQKFQQRESASLAEDVDGNPVYLASSRYKLQITQERFPTVGFHATREHGAVVEQG